MATNQVTFSELALGDIFSVVTSRKEFKNQLFVKIMRSGGKHGAMPLDDYNRISVNPSALIIGDYHIETDCKHWICQKKDLAPTVKAKKKTIPKEEETKLIGLYDRDIDETKMFRVTAKQLKVIYYMYQSGWLNCDDIIENPDADITDLTTE